jgi:purine-binding chemotaxis protein CheW
MGQPRQRDRMQIVVFTLDEPRCALDLAAVERIVRAVEITPLPKAPEIVLGVINIQGRILPVVDIRHRFQLPARELSLEQRFIVARASRRPVALVVDSVVGVRELESHALVSAERDLALGAYLKGVAKLEDGLLLIYDLDRFLALDEELALDAALSGGPA